ncbi:hypothetical protein SEA_KEELAN_22 [Gordonia phage Keelan]|nr:hypothetical protein SEA_KEELAN_22 [Gordonia phage Keelan]
MTPIFQSPRERTTMTITAEQGAKTMLHMAQVNLMQYELRGDNLEEHAGHEFCPIGASLRIVEKGEEHHAENWRNGTIEPFVQELTEMVYHKLVADGIFEE